MEGELETPIPLGPFEIRSLIGKGGMGEVWQGVHRAQQLPVAIKVITSVRARNPEFRAAFRNEVRAVAGLNHPGVVMVFDFGTVTEEAESLSSGQLQAGSPYLVMELVSGKSLSQADIPMAWPQLEAVLTDLLKTLAHAHARGVIHRDLKPNNVLLQHGASGESRLKIIDFGLASTGRWDGVDDPGLAAGAPAFEAPEKILGHFRDQGPWTDLYSLGCIAYSLASGRPPFQGDHDRLVRCQLIVPMPALQSCVSVPHGFEAWIRRLLTKHPRDRFRRAADALHALKSLDVGVLVPPVAESGPSRSGAVESLSDITSITRPHSASENLRQKLYREPMLPTDASEEACPVRVPPIPETWRANEDTAPESSMKLFGAGLGLFGLRSMPLVGRETEMDLLWGALSRVVRTGRAEAMLLLGDAGNGKTRLAECFSERAHELGVATTVQATHSPIHAPGDGLPKMITRHFGAFGLSRERVLERTKRILSDEGIHSDYEWNALTELMMPASPDDHEGGARVIHFGSPAARYAPMRRFLERLAHRRAVIVWLEDVQLGSEAIGFARDVLKRQDAFPTPLLFVLSARDEALDPASVEAGMLADLMAMDRASQVELNPLPPNQFTGLVEDLLGLEGELATRVAVRCAGNPLFAVQLVGDWVHRGVLQVGEAGFKLKPGEQAVIPDDIHQLWSGRIERVLDGQHSGATAALELAAALGREVHHREWSEACRLAGVTPPERFVERLVDHRLARRSQEGWTWVHGMVRESIRRASIEADRWADHHRTCAKLLGAHPIEQPGIPERLGTHLVGAGEFAAAIEPLIEGARHREDESQYRTARALLSARERCMHRANVPAQDVRWGEGRILLAGTLSVQGRYDEALEITDGTATDAQAFGWDEVLAEARAMRGYVAHQRGDFGQAIQCYEDALAMYKALEHPVGESNCLVRLGQAARLTGHFDRATWLLQEAREVFPELEDRRGISMCLRNLGVVAQHAGDLVSASDLIQRARALYETVGNQYGVAICLNDLAEIARVRGALESAERGYRQALTIFNEVGSTDGIISQMNLGLILILRGRFDEAGDVLTETRNSLGKDGRRWFLGAVHTALLPCSAHRRDWEAWDSHYSHARRLLESTKVVDADLAWTLELGANMAEERSEGERALLVFELALRQWRALDDTGKVDEMCQRIQSLESSQQP